MDERARLIEQILDCGGTMFRSLHAGQNQAWQNVELTMPQLKALLYVAQHEQATSGQVARALGVGLSTVTGVVDRLVEHELVMRREDRDDRRITRVLPTPAGSALVGALLRFRDERLTALLSRLSDDQLEVVDAAFRYLVTAAGDLAAEQQPREVLA